MGQELGRPVSSWAVFFRFLVGVKSFLLRWLLLCLGDGVDGDSEGEAVGEVELGLLWRTVL